MIRICNICLKTLEDDIIMDDDEDDRRSIVSSTPSLHPAHHHRQSLEAVPQSPFAASQLFGRSEEPFNLFSIPESRGNLSSDAGTRPPSPGETGSVQTWDLPTNRAAAPFRRGLEDEEVVHASLDTGILSTTPSGVTPAQEKIAFPFISDNAAPSSIQFPGSSPEQTLEVSGEFRSRADSDLDLQTPFMRSRAPSRLNEVALLAGEAGWRTRRESTALVCNISPYVLLINLHL